jgi:hypothetical protein
MQCDVRNKGPVISVYNNFAVADRVSVLGGRLVNSDKGPNREREGGEGGRVARLSTEKRDRVLMNM